MRTFICTAFVTVALALGVLINSCAVAAAGTYQDALRQCGAEWRASEARNNAKRGERMDAWQAFRKECVARVGYETKRSKKS